MEKFFTILLAVFLLSSAALAEVPDISGLSFEELVALREQVNMALWKTEEWQEVTVPAGTYAIGKDIPAGHWNVRVAGSNAVSTVFYANKIDPVSLDPDYGSDGRALNLASQETNDSLGWGYPSETDFEMKDGWFFGCSSAVIFTPYTGKPDLGFK